MNKPAHQVIISQPFHMQTMEVTQGQWKAVMGGANPSYFPGCGDNCPVERVSWNDIQTFLTTLNGMGQGTYRLPTEAEWEHAARAGTTTIWSFGDSPDIFGNYDWCSQNSNNTTHLVAQKLANSWGLYDMHGNVWEWTSDWYESYTNAAATDPTGATSGSYRVFRGGAWLNGCSAPVRPANRSSGTPGLRDWGVGFRLVKVVPVPTAAFTVSSTSGDTSTTFQFDASGSSDLQDAASDLQVRWDWEGDGTWDTGFSATKTASHQFTTPGTYTVKMQVKDSAGLTTIVSHSVAVTVALPTTTNSLGMTFKLIPAGTFNMGCSGPAASGEVCQSNEQPVHQVTISQPFHMQTTEVTQGQWKAVMGGANPSSFKSCGDTCPVDMVSWTDIQTFLTTLNGMSQGIYRLPTEAEWEYAARAGTTTAWSFGDNSNISENYAWYATNSNLMTHPVDQKLPNPWGLYDMHGHIWQWVSDWYSATYYTTASVTNPVGPTSSSSRVIRGGGYAAPPGGMRSAYRTGTPPDYRDSNQSFRLVKVP
ncbi:MAG: SUMF1/EgtB/PvdO family nonheme iron enzyme [Magnetococcales bacterium]|nr:SUMF1/EgtB/PvdO family nonheme iron enzyme [Magnetococcales bacterium]